MDRVKVLEALAAKGIEVHPEVSDTILAEHAKRHCVCTSSKDAPKKAEVAPEEPKAPEAPKAPTKPKKAKVAKPKAKKEASK